MKVVPVQFKSVAEIVCDEFHQRQGYEHKRANGSGDWLLIYTVSGSGTYSSLGKTLCTKAGDVILYAPEQKQQYGTAGDHWNLLWVHFPSRSSWDHWLDWPRDEAGVRMMSLPGGEVRESLEEALRRMVRLNRRQLTGASELARNALEAALLWARSATSDDPWHRKDGRIRRAVDVMTADMRTPFDLTSLAGVAGLSVSRFEHLFKQTMGCTPVQFLEGHRMDQARNLLRVTTLSVGEIAAEVGYEDAFYFSHRFRRHAGQSPRAFRQSLGEG